MLPAYTRILWFIGLTALPATAGCVSSSHGPADATGRDAGTPTTSCIWERQK